MTEADRTEAAMTGSIRRTHPYPRPDWTFVRADALTKVFPDDVPPAAAQDELSGFLGETLSFQVAYLPPAHGSGGGDRIRVEVDEASAPFTVVSTVELVPVTLAAFDGHDAGYLRDAPGLYPDLLKPLPDGALVRPLTASWGALWFDVRIDEAEHAGSRTVGVRIVRESDSQVLYQVDVPVQVHPVDLPALDIINTHWLHADCLADYYGVEAFSAEHWERLEAFIGAAARMRVTSLLTPTWTPPLDTAVGGTRTPVQLVGIADDGNGYAFDFSRLGRWLALCRKHGITTVEIAHLFTQWGAKATPAIYVDTPSGRERRFGWHVPATDPRYRDLLEQLLPALRAYLDQEWPEGSVLWHISDEPHPADRDTYLAAREVVHDLLAGADVADALSDFDFVDAVAIPIVATDAVEPFRAAGMNPFVYYCVSQHTDVANRFIAMPSVRNRVLGRQLFVNRAPGFLHWGFNFWNTQFSLGSLDPFADTCAGGAFPGGDASIVYPAPDGTAWPSVRYRVFTQGMDDHRALQLLRDLTDHDTAASYVDQGGELSYSRFDYDRRAHLNARRAVDERILAELAAPSK
ncbi:DUF4091 domain-containing protein [Pseudactinotalea sp. Z1732]|uniref:DUF4091 domain-containing protein n=1 Tax=Micrococcales TaxID=85006 RepID=UPI003C7A5673